MLATEEDGFCLGGGEEGVLEEEDRLTPSSLQNCWGVWLPASSNARRLGSFSSSSSHEQERSPSLYSQIPLSLTSEHQPLVKWAPKNPHNIGDVHVAHTCHGRHS